jgi:D-glycero-D-manno-heptose 1,7-bisphosphate phosphatase
VIVTNQAGIGRGYYTEEDFFDLMDWMKEQFVEHRGQIDAVYFSPYHPEFGIGEYKRESKCRKPSPGMLLQAKDEFNIDMVNSLLIGDNLSDMVAGKKAGVGKLLLFGREEVEKGYLTIKNLSDALPMLLEF